MKEALMALCMVLQVGCGDGGSDKADPGDNSAPVEIPADGNTGDIKNTEVCADAHQDSPAPDDNPEPVDMTSHSGDWGESRGGPDRDSGEDCVVPGDATVPEDAAASDDGSPGEVSAPDTGPSETGPEPYQPGPIPYVDEDGLPLPCQAALDDPWYFQFLDNLCNEKVFPSSQDRDRTCPLADESPFVTLQDGTVVEYKSSSAPVAVDGQALKGIVPDSLKVMVILIRRIDGVPHYRYISNGFHDAALQPWSTTKFLAIANAAAYLRVASNYGVGLTASAKGYKLGDLATAVHTYDNNPASSNGLAAWFHDIGGRQQANALIHELWLKRPAAETFGGNYGDASPSWLGYTFHEPDGGPKVTVTPDNYCCFANNLSLFTLAEALKRLAVHMHEPDQRLPGIQWADIKQLFYGALESTYGKWGGMSSDTAIYIQMGHDIDYIEDRSKGQWTIFSKLGLGSQGQFMDVGHACWPVLDDNLDPVPGWGREFVIATHLSSGGASWDERDRLLATCYRKIITRIVDGRL